MKRIISNVMLVAAAAMAFFACQKPEVIAPEFEEVNGLAFTSEKPSFDDETKTQWTGETIQWSDGDKIRVAYTAGGVWQNAQGTATSDEVNGKKTARIYVSNSVEAGETASFSVPGDFTIPKDVDLKFYGVYPSTAASDASMPYAPSVTVTIPAEQKPLANSFDSKADLMAAKSVSTYILSDENPLPETIPLMWTRLVAHGHLTLKNLQVEDGEKLLTITLTADKDADMVGEHYLYLEDTYNVEKANGNNVSNSLTVKADNLTIAEGGNVTFWTCFLPCTWKSLDVVVETDKATYTRSIDLTGNEKTFKQNARNTLAINMAEANRAVKNASSLPFVKDFSDKTNTNGITVLDGFTVSGSVYNAVGAIRLAKGEGGGSITTQSLDLSCDFHVKVTASGWDDNELDLIVSSGDQSETVTLSAVGNGNSGPGECAEHIINFQPVSNSSSVTFEASAGKRCYIKKIEILEGHAVAAPVLKATAPNEIAAAGGEGSFTFTLANPQDGQSVSAESNVGWITDVVVSDGQVTYTVAENTSEEPREGTITLSYEGAEPVDVTITQAEKPAEDVDGTPAFVKVTSAPSDWSGTYLIVFESLNKYWDGSLKGGTSSGQFGHTAGAKSITIANNTIEKNESYFTIVKSGTNYTITSASGDVIGNSGTSAGLKIGSSYTCTITLNNDNTVNILASDGNTQVLYNKSANYIRFYKTSNAGTNSYGLPCLYRLENGESSGENLKPEIAISSGASVNVEAAGATGTVSYTLTNAVAEAKVSAQANQTWVTIGTITSTSVPFTVSENTGGERTATITLSYDGAESKTVNITQAAAQSGGGDDAELKTSSLVLSSSKKFGTTSGSKLNADDSQVWKITTISGGAIQNTFNTSYQGQQIGTGTSPWVGTFTSDFSGKNIKSIKILANTGEKASLSVTVGNVDFGTKSVTKNSSQALEYLFEGSASGNVTIKVSDTKKAFYLGAIVVTYN